MVKTTVPILIIGCEHNNKVSPSTHRLYNSPTLSHSTCVQAGIRTNDANKIVLLYRLPMLKNKHSGWRYPNTAWHQSPLRGQYWNGIETRTNFPFNWDAPENWRTY